MASIQPSSGPAGIDHPAVAAAPKIAVVGPTASGKSELAVALAERFGGEIISTDSMQVYRYMDVGTAKPAVAMRARVPHHLIDRVDPDEAYSAGSYVADASRVIARLKAEGKPAILCGGTGLYFRALLFRMADVPHVAREMRERVTALHEERGLAACRAELERLDPEGAAALHPHDSARTLRALEVVLATGRSVRAFRQEQPYRVAAPNLLSVGVEWPRAHLYARIDARVQAMLAGGWIDEVRGLLDRGYGRKLKPLRAIGYKEIAAHVQGLRGREGLEAEIAQRTRRYAKRQLTWFRRHPDIRWCEPGRDDQIFRQVESFLGKPLEMEKSTP